MFGSEIFLLAISHLSLSTQQALSVIVGVVSERDVTPQFQNVGRVEAVETVDLRARVEGWVERQAFREIRSEE